MKFDLLKPPQVFLEYGIKPRALAYMRELSDDLGRQIGPRWINPKDTEIYFYPRHFIEEWIAKDMINFENVEETDVLPDTKSTKSTKDTKDLNNQNIHKFQKK
jgi:hypothetical protein